MSHCSMTILSNVDPFSFSFQTTESIHSLQEARWHSLWRSFGIVYFQTNPLHTRTPQDAEKSPNPEDRRLDRMIEEECCWTPVLKNLGMMYKHLAFHESNIHEQPCSKTTVSRAIFQLARAYYEEIWQSLTTDERLALFHLSKDRFIHIEHPGLESLLQKGLIRFDPDLCLLNDSFREFVRVVGKRDALQDHEAQKGNSLWRALKWPMGLGFGTILLFLIVTQEELRAALPAVIALGPLIFRGLPELSTVRQSMKALSN